MDTANRAFTELEQRLEKTRKQKSKLGHELGKKLKNCYLIELITKQHVILNKNNNRSWKTMLGVS
jgi:hypothetical protein